MKIEFKYNNDGYLFDISHNDIYIAEVFSKEIGIENFHSCSYFKRQFFVAIYKYNKLLGDSYYVDSKECFNFK